MPINLEELSQELDISPSGLRKRIHSLGLPVEKGSRGKWIIPDDLLDTLREADRLMKDGAGANTTRRVLGLTSHPSIPDQRATDPTGEALTTEPGTSADGEESPARDRSLTVPAQDSGELRQVLELLAAERERSATLQHQVVELMGKVADLNGTCSMYQERASNLSASMQQLEEKVLLLEAPKEEPRPWWKRILGQ